MVVYHIKLKEPSYSNNWEEGIIKTDNDVLGYYELAKITTGIRKGHYKTVRKGEYEVL